MSAFLEVEVPGKEVKRVKLGPLLSIGRDRNSTLQLEDRSASRNHAVIMAQGKNRFQVSDLMSRNGTMLNGRRLTSSTYLKTGDLIVIGDCRMRFMEENAKPAVDRGQELESVTIAHIQTRKVVVFVMDIRGYTKLSEALSAEELTEMATFWFVQLGSTIERNGGVVDKIIGDAVMALWVEGSEKIHKHAHHAVQTAYQALELAKGFETKLQETHPELQFRVGCGINVGVAALGNVGHRDNRDFTAMGDCVNVAFRVESMCRPLKQEILVTSEVEKMIRGQVQSIDMGEHELKGKSKATQLFGIVPDSIGAPTDPEEEELNEYSTGKETYLQQAERLFYEGHLEGALRLLENHTPPAEFATEHNTKKIVILVQLQKWDQALDAAEMLSSVTPDDDWLIYITSLSHFQLGNLEKARDVQKSADAGQFDLAHINNLMACVELGLGNVEEACKYAKRTVEIEPQLLDYFFSDEGFKPLWETLEPFKASS